MFGQLLVAVGGLEDGAVGVDRFDVEPLADAEIEAGEDARLGGGFGEVPFAIFKAEELALRDPAVGDGGPDAGDHRAEVVERVGDGGAGAAKEDCHC